MEVNFFEFFRYFKLSKNVSKDNSHDEIMVKGSCLILHFVMYGESKNYLCHLKLHKTSILNKVTKNFCWKYEIFVRFAIHSSVKIAKIVRFTLHFACADSLMLTHFTTHFSQYTTNYKTITRVIFQYLLLTTIIIFSLSA